MAATTLKLARLQGEPEIFHSIQGEGVSSGCPSVFVRASLCNLHCRWCDTDYTWNWEGTPWVHENDSNPDYKKFNKAECIIELEIADVVEKVNAYPCPRVILTGGEPLLQDSAWQELMTQLIAEQSDYYFEVETNGTLVPSAEFDHLIHQYNVSPKLENSGNSQEKRRCGEALEFFSQSSKAWFKFVVNSEQDLTEIKQLITNHQIPPERVLLMPEGRDEATLRTKRLQLIESCLQNNYRFCDRLHIQLWGSKRGV